MYCMMILDWILKNISSHHLLNVQKLNFIRRKLNNKIYYHFLFLDTITTY